MDGGVNGWVRQWMMASTDSRVQRMVAFDVVATMDVSWQHNSRV